MRAEHPTTRWITSSYSANNGNCVELAWITSSYSTNNGDCVELARTKGTVLARDTKDREGGTLHLTPAAFTALVDTLRR